MDNVGGEMRREKPQQPQRMERGNRGTVNVPLVSGPTPRWAELKTHFSSNKDSVLSQAVTFMPSKSF